VVLATGFAMTGAVFRRHWEHSYSEISEVQYAKISRVNGTCNPLEQKIVFTKNTFLLHICQIGLMNKHQVFNETLNHSGVVSITD